MTPWLVEIEQIGGATTYWWSFDQFARRSSSSLALKNDALVEAWPLPLEGGLITRGQAIGHVMVRPALKHG